MIARTMRGLRAWRWEMNMKRTVRRKYPERKERDLSEKEKQGIRDQIQSGRADVYVLAQEFHCSSSQVAGIKAALSK